MADNSAESDAPSWGASPLSELSESADVIGDEAALAKVIGVVAAGVAEDTGFVGALAVEIACPLNVSAIGCTGGDCV